MRVLVTGQTGVEKGGYLEEVVKVAAARGNVVQLLSVGELMYQSDPTVRRGRILNLPLRQLRAMRREALLRIVQASVEVAQDQIINSHATFRWRNGLFAAFEPGEIHELQPEICITIIEDVDVVKKRLEAEGNFQRPLTLKDIIVWREEEILASELMAALAGCPHYVIARNHPPELILQLMYEPEKPRAYASFPISLVKDQPDVEGRINSFRSKIRNLLTVFDPYTITEKRLEFELNMAVAQAEGENRPEPTSVVVETLGYPYSLPLHEVKEILADIDGQIVARDYKLIEQSHAVIAFIPEVQGVPSISSGVEREMQYAYDRAKDVFVIWESEHVPSPFLQQTATKLFRTFDEALDFLTSYRP